MGVTVKETLPPIRRKRGLTQEELGARARIARTDIVAFETGSKDVGDARLQRLAEALEVSVLELGAPAEAADELGQSLLDRLAAAEAALDRERKRFDRFVRATTARLAALEEAQGLQAQRPARRRKA